MTVLDVEVFKAVAVPIAPGFVRAVLRRAAAVPELAARLPEGEASVAVRITDDEEMQRLNKAYAGDDHATDVLSFEGEGAHVGDIAISWPRVVEQAQEWGHTEKDEMSVLLVHGLLHLLGWDHATPAETEEMWRLTYIPLGVSAGGRRSPGRDSRSAALAAGLGVSGHMNTSGQRLIVGLGNPESEYADTRHNLGFACVRELARRLDVRIERKRWQSLVGRAESRGLWFVLPQTYMNLSGQAVAKAVKDTGVAAQDTWVVYDELDLPLCRMRIKTGGSTAGHNGVRSIIESLGRDDFVRFRVGVGKPGGRGSTAGIRHVLGRFTKAEKEVLPNVVAGVADALELALEAGVERAMDRYNRAGALGCDAAT